MQLKNKIIFSSLFFIPLFKHTQYIKNFYNRTVVSRNGTGLNGEQLTLMYSLTVSVFAIGGLIGSLMVGMLVTRFGRWVNRRPHNIWCCLVTLPGVVLLLPRVWQPPRYTLPHLSPHMTSADDLGHTLEEEQCCFVACRLKTSLTNFSDCCCDNKISQGIVLTQEFILIVICFYNGMHIQLCFNVRMRHNQNSSACPQRHSQTPLLVSSAPSVSREPWD